MMNIEERSLIAFRHDEEEEGTRLWQEARQLREEAHAWFSAEREKLSRAGKDIDVDIQIIFKFIEKRKEEALSTTPS